MLLNQRLATGQPLIVPRWLLPRDRPAISLFTDRSIRSYTLTADDVITAHRADS